MNAVNLIPSEGRQRRASLPASPQTLGLVAALVLVLGAAVVYVSATNRVSARKSELAKVTAGVAQWQAAGNSYSSFVQTASERLQDLTVVRQLGAQRFSWSRLLGQIGGVMPKQAALSSLQATTASADGASGAAAATPTATPTTTTSATTTTTPAAGTTTPAAGTTTTSAATSSTAVVPAVQLAGCAVNQSTVAQTMTQLREVQGVSDVTLSSSTESGAQGGSSSGSGGGCPFPVQFQISLTFDSGGADASATATAGPATTTSAPTSTTSTPAATTSTPASTTSTAATTTATPAAATSASSSTNS